MTGRKLNEYADTVSLASVLVTINSLGLGNIPESPGRIIGQANQALVFELGRSLVRIADPYFAPKGLRFRDWHHIGNGGRYSFTSVTLVRTEPPHSTQIGVDDINIRQSCIVVLRRRPRYLQPCGALRRAVYREICQCKNRFSSHTPTLQT